MQTLDDMIAVMQAAKDGKQIQCRQRKVSHCSPQEWIGYEPPYWNWVDFEYRVKPEPEYRVPRESDVGRKVQFRVGQQWKAFDLIAVLPREVNCRFIARTSHHGWQAFEEARADNVC